MKLLVRLRLDVLTILSAALITLGSPAFGLSFLGWICLVPFLLAVERQRTWKGALAQGLWLAVLVTAGVYHWLPGAVTEFHAMPGWAPWLFFPLYGLLAQPQLVAYALLRWAWRGRHDLPTAAASALLYTGLDWLVPKLFLDTIGQMLYADLALVQVVDLGGVYLLTLLLVLANEAVHAVLARYRGGLPLRPLRARILVVVALVAATLGYGLWRLAEVRAAQARPVDRLRAAVIQANVGNLDKLAAEKGDVEAVVDVLMRYGRLSDTQATGDAPPDLLIWPETAYPLAYGAERSPVDSEMDAELRQYASGRQIPLLFGGYHVADGREHNSALVVDPAGSVQVYHKHILMPFGEYVPLVDDWGAVREALPHIAEFGRGGTPLVLDVPLPGARAVKIAPIICYEALFAEHTIASANAGSQVIVNLTNDSWFGSEAQKRLHLALAALRSVETRRPQLRATNTGISALVLADGAVVDPGPVDQEASLRYQVPILDLPPTLAMRLGPWAGKVSLLAGALLGLALVVLRRRGQPRA
jgi:apolipoprotein N-acyltransferase